MDWKGKKKRDTRQMSEWKGRLSEEDGGKKQGVMNG